MTTIPDVSVERAASGGAVGRLPDGMTVFVRHALPGETVDVAITETHARYARGEAVSITVASSDRVPAPCPYAHPGGCGGCDLQHASPDAQLRWKSDVVAEQLRRVAKIDVSVTVEPSPNGLLGNRTRLRCAVDDVGHLALYQARSHDLIPIAACAAADPRFLEGITADWTGASEVELRALGDEEPFAIVSMEDGSTVTTDLDGLIDDGPRRSTVQVGRHRFRVSPGSFWQAHRDAPDVLTAAVLELAKVKRRDRVVDLYAGVGLFSVPLAHVVGPEGTVIAVEGSSAACADARRNVADYAQVTVVEGKVTPRRLATILGEDDVVVLDPPRTGAGVDVMGAIVAAKPRRIVYVSCDPATFARDVKVAFDAGWHMSTIRAFDLFPMTEHVEIVAVLDKVAK